MLRFTKYVAVLAFVASNAIAGQVPGTSVSIIPPNGYVAADQLPGFINESTGSSIKISELPGLFDEVTKRFSEDRLRALGITLLSKSTVNVDGHAGMLLHTEYSFQDTRFKNWIVLIDRSDTTTHIHARYPEAAAKQGELLKLAILTATLGKADPTDILAFSVTPLPPFKVGMVFGQNMALSPSGRLPVKDESFPIMILGLSECVDTIIPDKKAFSESRVAKTDGVKNISVNRITPITIGNLSGYVTIAQGEGVKTAIPLTIYQILLFNTSNYYEIQGITSSAEKDIYVPVFEKIAKSFKIKESHNK